MTKSLGPIDSSKEHASSRKGEDACVACKDDQVHELSKARKLAISLPIVVVWLAIDIIIKDIANEHALGEVFGPSIPGILELRLVHNTGGAWGMFGDMTTALGVVSILMCVAIAAFIFLYERITTLGVVALSLVFAGGLGNAIDRFENGYVIDMISTVFIDFPVFNVADIGVTCGVVLFIVSLLFPTKASDRSLEPSDPDMLSRENGGD